MQSNMTAIDLTQVMTPDSPLKKFKQTLKSLATNHKLAYAGESLLPENLLEVGERTYYGRTYNKVVQFLNSLGAGRVNTLLNPSGEEQTLATGHEGWSLNKIDSDTLDTKASALFELCKDCNIPEDRIMSTVENLLMCLNRYCGEGSVDDHFRIANASSLQGYHRLDSIYPASIISDATYSGNLIGREMFGANIPQKTLDIKTAMTITLVKGYKGLANRYMHRVSNDNGVVMFIVPNDEFYDLAKSQDKSSAVRDSWSHRNQLITLMTNPEPVDMEMIPVHLQKKLDPDNEYLLADDVLLPNKEVSLWDMSLIEGKAGYDQFNYTDLLSYKVALRAVHVEIAKGKVGEDGTVTTEGTPEQYVLNLTNFGAMTNFTHMNNTVANQADRSVQFVGRLPFDKDSMTADGERTTLFANLNRATEYVIAILHFNAITNLQSTRTHGSGSIEFRAVSSLKDTPVSDELKELVKTLNGNIIGWEIDARYSEENFRKTNMAVRAMSDVFSYTLPDGRTIVVDYSHRQTLAEHSLQVASEVQTIGIDHRDLQIVLKTIKATGDRIRNERVDKRYIENYDNMTVSKSFVSGRRVNPTIAQKTIDMSKVVIFQSSDMLSDHWTYMRACMNAITTEMSYRSLLLQQLEGAKVKYKVITTTPLLDTIWSLANIHENQMPSGKAGEMVFEQKTPGKPVEFKTTLPNGVELEFITTAFHYMKDTMILLPYRDNSPMDDLNFAVNFDGGQYSVNWTPTDGNNMTIRRSMQNTREYPIVLCGIAALITVINYDHLIPGMFNLDSAN